MESQFTDTLHRSVFECAQKHLQEPAIVFQNDCPCTAQGSSCSCFPAKLSYKDLMEEAASMASILTSVAPSPREIGILSSPNLHMVSALLSILMGGSAFVPLKPQHFKEHVLQMRITHIVAEESLRHVLHSELQAPMIETPLCAGYILFTLNNSTNVQASPSLHGESTAYILSTSGTTRPIPDIVAVPHSCIMPNIRDFIRLFCIGPGDTCFLSSPLTFDPSVVEIFSSLSAGACLLIVADQIKQSPLRLAAALQRHRVSLLSATPSLLFRLRQLVLGGEPCPPPAVLRRWWPLASACRVAVVYGTTELSCWAFVHVLSHADLQQPTACRHLGTPLSQTAWCVHPPGVPCGAMAGEGGAVVTTGSQSEGLMSISQGRACDGDRRELPSCCGELWIGGPRRICAVGGERRSMRATGDLVCCGGTGCGCDSAGLTESDLGCCASNGNTTCTKPTAASPSGATPSLCAHAEVTDERDVGPSNLTPLLFVGRADRTVKRVGHRINLDALEQRLLQRVPGLRAAALLLAGDSPPRLLACLVSTAPMASDQAQQQVSEVLQGPECPDAVHMFAELPMTPNGKVDRRLLLMLIRDSPVPTHPERPYSSHLSQPNVLLTAPQSHEILSSRSHVHPNTRPPTLHPPPSLPSPLHPSTYTPSLVAVAPWELVCALCSVHGIIARPEASLPDCGGSSQAALAIAQRLCDWLDEAEAQRPSDSAGHNRGLGSIAKSMEADGTVTESRRGRVADTNTILLPLLLSALIDGPLSRLDALLTHALSGTADTLAGTGNTPVGFGDVERLFRQRFDSESAAAVESTQQISPETVQRAELETVQPDSWPTSRHKRKRAGSNSSDSNLPPPHSIPNHQSINQPSASETQTLVQPDRRSPSPSPLSPSQPLASEPPMPLPRCQALQRCGVKVICGIGDHPVPDTFHVNPRSGGPSAGTSPPLRHTTPRRPPSPGSPPPVPELRPASPSSASDDAECDPACLPLRWAAGLVKCVDASPLVVQGSDGPGWGLVYAGSHAHVFGAWRLADGGCVWRTALGGRIESSAALTVCGRFVVVGCYDNSICALDARSGALWWRCATQGAVKSSPAAVQGSAVVVGAHDGRVRALDVLRRVCLWTFSLAPAAPGLDSSSFFSSPTVDLCRGRVLIASLSGILCCLHLHASEEGQQALPPTKPTRPTTNPTSTRHTFTKAQQSPCPDPLQAEDLAPQASSSVIPTTRCAWTHALGSPVFATACLLSDGAVVVGSVTGVVVCVDVEGALRWSFAAAAAVFSSACVLGAERAVVCVGCHKGNLYALDTRTGVCVWVRRLGGRVYASPCPFVGTRVLSPSAQPEDGGSAMPAPTHQISGDPARASPHAEGSVLHSTLHTDRVAVATTRGRLVVLGPDGHTLARCLLPAAVFSSPVVAGGHTVVLGCRDNTLRCLDLV